MSLNLQQLHTLPCPVSRLAMGHNWMPVPAPRPGLAVVWQKGGGGPPAGSLRHQAPRCLKPGPPPSPSYLALPAVLASWGLHEGSSLFHWGVYVAGEVCRGRSVSAGSSCLRIISRK